MNEQTGDLACAGSRAFRTSWSALGMSGQVDPGGPRGGQYLIDERAELVGRGTDVSYLVESAQKG
jgi:hypothetical protein